MFAIFRSIITAGCVAAGAVVLATMFLAPHVPPYVGSPAAEYAREIELPATSAVRVQNGDGAVDFTVSESPDSSIQIHLTVRGYAHGTATQEDVAVLIRDIVSAIQQDDETVLVTITDALPPTIDVVVDYAIEVPAGTNVEVVGGNGNIRVARGCGAVKTQGLNADISILSPGGRVVADTVNGRVDVRDIIAEAQLGSVNGDVRATIIAGKVVIASETGDVHAKLQGPHAESVNIRTTTGAMYVTIPEEAGFVVAALAPRDRIRSTLNASSEHFTQGAFEASHGDKHTKLTLDTIDGSIDLMRTP